MSGIYTRLNRLSRFCVWTFTPKSSILRRKTLPLNHQFELPLNVVQTQQRVSKSKSRNALAASSPSKPPPITTPVLAFKLAARMASRSSMVR